MFSYISSKSSKQAQMFSINCKGKLVRFEEPLVMGIMNVTPDSFFAGSRVNREAGLARAEEMLLQGAAFIDIGGQSTRPGSERVSEDEELKRVIPVVETIAKNFPLALLSIDTFYSKVAKYAVEAGACIVNDVSAGSIDADLIDTVAALQVPYVLMHMKGDPQTMQQSPAYDDVVTEVFDSLNRNISRCRKAGIMDIIIDPGFGFGKTIEHNFILLSRLQEFKALGNPIMVGLSRKSTIYKTLGVKAEESLNGSSVMHTMALMNGADILRVHDVKEAREAVILYRSVEKQKEQY
jgi:dihydropteroate synthase